VPDYLGKLLVYASGVPRYALLQLPRGGVGDFVCACVGISICIHTGLSIVCEHVYWCFQTKVNWYCIS
jgi:hypothetical protein